MASIDSLECESLYQAHYMEDSADDVIGHPRHPQRIVLHPRDGPAKVDEELAALLPQLWQLGCQTYNSCQDNHGKLWIEFDLRSYQLLMLKAQRTLHSWKVWEPEKPPTHRQGLWQYLQDLRVEAKLQITDWSDVATGEGHTQDLKDGDFLWTVSLRIPKEDRSIFEEIVSALIAAG